MRFLYKLVLAALAGAAVLVGMTWFLDARATAAALSSLSWIIIPWLAILSLAGYYLRFLKWQYYLKLIGADVPKRVSAGIFFSGFMMAVTPGKLGEVLKAYLLKRLYGIKMRITTPVVLAERLTDVLALLALSVAGAATLHYGRRALLVVSTLTVLGVAMLSWRTLMVKLIVLCERLPLVDRVAHKLHEAYDSTATLIAPGPLVWATLLSIPAWAAEGVAFYAIFCNLHGPSGQAVAPPPLMGAIFVYSFSTLVGALSMLPGGLGAAEAGLAGLTVTLFAIPRGTAAAATLVIRLVTLWFAVLLGTMTFAAFQSKFGHRFADVESVKQEEGDSGAPVG
ncbi:MAG: flippase-like domain-containing protein [Candidatus Riflebacteria bacterium]|nr:flippase-like domain-containing protein [Candidatus Riflebacteria bacterium]